MAFDRRGNEVIPVRRTVDIEPQFGVTPFNMMRRLTDDMERFFEDFNNLSVMPRLETDFGFPRMTELLNIPRTTDLLNFPRMAEFEKSVWWPEIEVLEKNGELTVRADLPGLRKDDINIELTDGAVVISGERKLETKEEREGYFHSERNYGSFCRSIPLPEGADMNKANAVFHDGVLEVTIAVPKRELKGRKLEIAEKAPKAHAKTAG